jgi:hypothetical protein
MPELVGVGQKALPGSGTPISMLLRQWRDAAARLHIGSGDVVGCMYCTEMPPIAPIRMAAVTRTRIRCGAYAPAARTPASVGASLESSSSPPPYHIHQRMATQHATTTDVAARSKGVRGLKNGEQSSAG